MRAPREKISIRSTGRKARPSSTNPSWRQPKSAATIPARAAAARSTRSAVGQADSLPDKWASSTARGLRAGSVCGGYGLRIIVLFEHRDLPSLKRKHHCPRGAELFIHRLAAAGIRPERDHRVALFDI